MRTTLSMFLVAALAPACATDTTSDDADTASDEGGQLGAEHASDAQDDLGGESGDVVAARTGAIMIALDTAEVAQANLALQRSNDPDVIAFAQDLVASHQENIDETKNVMDDLAIAAEDNAISAALTAEANVTFEALVASNDFDYAFIRAQISGHAEANAILGTLEGLVTYDELQRFIANDRAMVGRHQEKAVLILRTGL